MYVHLQVVTDTVSNLAQCTVTPVNCSFHMQESIASHSALLASEVQKLFFHSSHCHFYMI